MSIRSALNSIRRTCPRVILPTQTHKWLLALSTVLCLTAASQDASAQCNETGELVASDARTLDYLGTSVDIDGDVIVVGAIGNSGYAYVYRKVSGDWVEEASLTASTGGGTKFGQSVAVDGNLIAVGAWSDDTQGSDSGAAFIFKYNGATWDEVKKIHASDAFASDQFGRVLALDQGTLVVGAPEKAGAGVRSGAAYVFRDLGFPLGWTEVQKITASDASSSDVFGDALALSGNRLLVGAQGADGAQSATGAVYAFSFDGQGWNETQKILGSDSAGSDGFGSSVSIEGDDAVIGALGNDGSGSNAGAAYVFVHGAGAWNQTQKLDRGIASEQFGESVAVSGNAILVGCPRVASAYSFVRKGGVWAEDQSFAASDQISSSFFGETVALQGSTGVVGSPNHSHARNLSGSAYVVPVRSFFLEIEPESVSAGDTMNIDSFCGNPGDPILFAVWSINGTFAFNPLFLFQFQADHRFGFPVVVPPGLSGNTFEFQTLKLDAFMNVLGSAPEPVQFL